MRAFTPLATTSNVADAFLESLAVDWRVSFTSQSETKTTAQARTAEPSGTDLYEQLDKYYIEAAREVMLGAPQEDSTALIHYIVPCFNRYSAGALSVNRLLNYINRHYVRRAVDEDKG